MHDRKGIKAMQRGMAWFSRKTFFSGIARLGIPSTILGRKRQDGTAAVFFAGDAGQELENLSKYSKLGLC